MMKKIPCPVCEGWGHISEAYENGVSGYQCKECLGTGQIEVPMTNADRIRAMSDEELAEWLVKKTVYQESAWSAPSYLNFLTGSDDTMESAIKGTVNWLQQPVKEGADQ